ncbi:MAG: sigma-70 family RNA polymerase sigma factor [Pirellulaceae bacterium]
MTSRSLENTSALGPVLFERKADAMTDKESDLTRASLLIRIRSKEDQTAWKEFVHIYAPLIYGFARKQGLQDADAADVAQDVMTSINLAVSNFEYEPQKGRFRSYLYKATHNQICKIWKLNAGKIGTGNSAVHLMLSQAPASNEDEELWNRQHKWRLFEWAAEKVRAEFETSTWQAFTLTSIDHLKPAEAAERLNISVGAVYIAKSRVIKRIRETVREIEDE